MKRKISGTFSLVVLVKKQGWYSPKWKQANRNWHKKDSGDFKAWAEKDCWAV